MWQYSAKYALINCASLSQEIRPSTTFTRAHHLPLSCATKSISTFPVHVTDYLPRKGSVILSEKNPRETFNFLFGSGTYVIAWWKVTMVCLRVLKCKPLRSGNFRCLYQGNVIRLVTTSRNPRN